MELFLNEEMKAWIDKHSKCELMGTLKSVDFSDQCFFPFLRVAQVSPSVDGKTQLCNSYELALESNSGFISKLCNIVSFRFEASLK